MMSNKIKNHCYWVGVTLSPLLFYAVKVIVLNIKSPAKDFHTVSLPNMFWMNVKLCKIKIWAKDFQQTDY